MKNVSKAALSFFLVLLPITQTLAAPAWYRGEIREVALTVAQDNFLVSFESEVLSDCEYNRVWFSKETLGEFKFNGSYTMALTAAASGRNFGVVIDKAVNGPGGRCFAMGMTAAIQ